ncbi:alkaline phosphatase D family protein [Halocatena salina]|uniref:Alkaline phosphatase D family protein n=1 Tax=Halocatena salina TaxID=2934340 RepID=A0A8U0A6B6_9EURY|nr:alkaline phosphatase D family protein [Halocatena salina]UPM44399.1 alkaline phosphatase D family protein [Halocatena salina]
MEGVDQFESDRRTFLHRAGATAMVVGFAPASGPATGAAEETKGPFENDPFTLGVASGDPLPDSVVLWTRLAPEPLSEDGGMPDRSVPVQWWVARDEEMDGIVKTGTTNADSAWAHSVHVDVGGLAANTEYFYQFTVGPYRSPVGRTKTAPKAGTEIDSLTFAFASCQNYPAGYHTAHAKIAHDKPDVAIHLGDYIYEGKQEGSLGRGHEPPREITSKDDYRIRYAQYKTDPDLQAAHAACPWIVTWDDHEVENNYADEISQNEDPPAEFLERRANAYQAYFEHQPLRPTRKPDGPDLPLYRRFTFGELVEFNVLDTRQYRDDQVYSGDAAADPDRTLLGDEQESWLFEGLTESNTRWNVLANQVPVAPTDENPHPEKREFGGGDKWDGYRASRERLLSVLERDSVRNPVVITGDVHRNYAYDVKADATDPDAETVATEYVGTSISSFGDGTGLTGYDSELGEPWQQFANDDRGYVRCTITPDQWRTDYRVVSTVEKPNASVETIASFVTGDREPGAQLDSERPPHEPLVITEIQPNSPDSDDLEEEYVILRNTGDTTVDCSGFRLGFEGWESQFYTFDEFTLDAGQTVTVRNGTGKDTASTRYTGFDDPVLNDSSPDLVIVANDDGIVLDEASYAPNQEQRETNSISANQ